MKFLIQFWRGQFPLGKTFWWGWFAPLVGGNLLFILCAQWIVDTAGLTTFYVSAVIVSIFGAAAVVPVWRSAAGHTGPRVYKYGSRAIATIVAVLQAFSTAVVTVFIVVVVMKPDGLRYPEKQIRQHLRMDPAAPIDIWSVRSKVLTIVHIGEQSQDVMRAISGYGLGITTEQQPTPCWPGDNGPLCAFYANAWDPGGKRQYWIEFFFKEENGKQVLEDVAVTFFKDKSVRSTSKFYPERD